MNRQGRFCTTYGAGKIKADRLFPTTFAIASLLSCAFYSLVPAAPPAYSKPIEKTATAPPASRTGEKQDASSVPPKAKAKPGPQDASDLKQTTAKQNSGDDDTTHSGPDITGLGIDISHMTMANINDAIKANPKSASLLLTRGCIFMIDTDVENARADLNKALQLDPHCAKAHIGLGCLYKFEGKWKEAEAEFKKAEQVAAPEYAIDAVFDSAFLHRELAQYPQSLTEYNKVINSGFLNNHRLSFAFFQRGELYLRTGKPKLGIADLEKSVKLDPTSMLPLLALAKTYAGDRQFDKAVSTYTKVIQNEGKKQAIDELGGQRSLTTRALLERSDVYVKMGRRDLAEQDRAATRKIERRMLDAAPFLEH